MASAAILAVRSAPRSIEGSLAQLRRVYDQYPGVGRAEWYRRRDAVAGQLASNEVLRGDALEFLVRSPERSDFAGTLQCALFEQLLVAGDRRKLVRMLANVPVEVDDPDGYFVEYSLVNPYLDRPLENFTILFEAWEAATRPEVKRTIASSFLRAFSADIHPAWCDEEVVAHASRVFDRDRKAWKVNREWRKAYNPGLFHSFDGRGETAPPLFIPMDGPDEVREVRRSAP